MIQSIHKKRATPRGVIWRRHEHYRISGRASHATADRIVPLRQRLMLALSSSKERRLLRVRERRYNVVVDIELRMPKIAYQHDSVGIAIVKDLVLKAVVKD